VRSAMATESARHANTGSFDAWHDSRIMLAPMAGDRLPFMTSWIAAWTPLTTHGRLYLKPDDRLYVAMLTAWIALVAVVTYLLLGWAAAGVLVSVAGLFGLGGLAFQSRQHGRARRSLPRTADSA
jgi:hypothetical protein